MSIGDSLKSALASYIAKKALAFLAQRFAFVMAPPWGAIISYLVPLVINWVVKKFSNPEKQLNAFNVKELEVRVADGLSLKRMFHQDHPTI